MSNFIKISALATVAALGTASIASANNSFSFSPTLDSSSTLDLGIVRADAPAVVEVYNFQGGEVGELLGSTPVNAGANGDVRVNVGINPRFDVIAFLKFDGQTVATKDYDINTDRM